MTTEEHTKFHILIKLKNVYGYHSKSAPLHELCLTVLPIISETFSPANNTKLGINKPTKNVSYR